MSKLQEKLNEISCEKNRGNILKDFAGEFQKALDEAELSCDKDKLKYGAWSTWKKSQWTTTRGNINSWVRSEYETWLEVVSSLSLCNFPESENGWLLFSPDGPYFKIQGHIFKKHLDDISNYAAKYESFDIAWLGDKRDFGIITEYNPTEDGKVEFEICKWGL